MSSWTAHKKRGPLKNHIGTIYNHAFWQARKQGMSFYPYSLNHARPNTLSMGTTLPGGTDFIIAPSHLYVLLFNDEPTIKYIWWEGAEPAQAVWKLNW